MGCFDKVKDKVKGFDLFSQKVGFRLDEGSDYESFTGGFCSIIVYIIFLAIFTQTITNTLDKKYVTSTTTMFEEIDPTHYEVGTKNFIFAIGVTGINLNEGDRWFDISMQFRSYGLDGRNKTYMNLVPCQRSQWTTVNETFGEVYDRIGLDSWLCPQNGTQIQLQGKFTSEQFKFYKFAVTECDPTLDLTRPCANSSEIDAYLNEQETFSFNFYFVNTIINGGNHEYLTYFLQDMNYFPFSTTSGISTNLFMSSYTITTDQSIYPLTQIKNDTGGIVRDLAQVHNYEVRQNEYLRLYLRKSSKDLLVQRSFRKVDDTLSYIGGLFSLILAALLFMGMFNEISFELEIAKSLYHYKKHEPIDSNKFNFLVYLGFIVFNWLDAIGLTPPWNSMKKYNNSLEEVRKQMDIRLVMKKIEYSERAINAILEDHKSKLLHLQEPLTLEEAEVIRKDHEFYDNLEKYYFLQDLREDTEETNINCGSTFIQKNRVSNESRSNSIVIEKNENQGEEVKEEISEEQEKKECDEMLKEMKQQFLKLQVQARNGDMISQRILEKLDHKIKEKFIQTKPKDKNRNKRMAVLISPTSEYDI